MPTFQEIQARYHSAMFQKTILEELVSYLDRSFRAHAGSPPKNVLTTDERIPVPDEEFEELITGFLVPRVEALKGELAQIRAFSLTAEVVQPAAAPETPTPPAAGDDNPVPQETSTRRTRRRRTQETPEQPEGQTNADPAAEPRAQ